MKPTIKQKCPFCDETLDYEVSTAAESEPNDRGGVNITVHAKTTPASTAHVWTHAPKGES
ncbi:MAG: hypothetical protein M3536_10935 [Actinomycetota bacterium]|nr:hypothetical protein [Actinomycetota bacterium]